MRANFKSYLCSFNCIDEVDVEAVCLSVCPDDEQKMIIKKGF